jgi:hypothetical protein
MMITLGPFATYLRDRFPPSSNPDHPVNPADPNTYVPMAADLIKRHTRNAWPTRRHKLGVWTCPRCDPGSAAWFARARAMGQCVKNSVDIAASQDASKQCNGIDEFISVPLMIFLVF